MTSAFCPSIHIFLTSHLPSPSFTISHYTLLYSLPLPKNIKISKKVRQVSVAPLLSKIIETELYNHMGVTNGDDMNGGTDDDNEFEEVS
jgi:hypothetical protein